MNIPSLKFVVRHLLHPRTPDYQKLDLTASQLGNQWNIHNETILLYLAQFEWREKDINVYLMDVKPGGRSLPLIVDINSPYPFHTLVHELIHRVLGEREELIAPQLYPDEAPLIAGHVLIHAIHEDIYRNLLNDLIALNEDKRLCQQNQVYKRAWELVERDGYKNIIANIKKAL